jgi:hypothetical protein
MHFRFHVPLETTYAVPVLELRLVVVADLVASCMVPMMEQSMKRSSGRQLAT